MLEEGNINTKLNLGEGYIFCYHFMYDKDHASGSTSLFVVIYICKL